ncbi:MAG TPA: TIM barrel protein [Acidobacteriota bacterium]|nr:TIM barrel protein [Acidobacteriota bacterium]
MTSSTTTRRDFLKISGAGVAALSFAPAQENAAASNEANAIKKGVLINMLPGELSYEERFRLAQRVGFEGLEARTVVDQSVVAEIKEAAQKTGITIHSVMNMDHWKYPLSSADPAVVEKSMQGMRTSLQNAKEWGAGAVLLVPAVVNPETSYKDAYSRSQERIRELIPLAKELGVVIGVENVWNKFLLSPLEFARYIDELDSPWVKAYFDVGNVVLFGYPQDWIRILGDRIIRIHLKDFDFEKKEFVPLREGSIDWPEVRAALREIRFKGFATVELRGGDEAYLKEVSSRVDRILAGA